MPLQVNGFPAPGNDWFGIDVNQLRRQARSIEKHHEEVAAGAVCIERPDSRDRRALAIELAPKAIR